MGSVSLVGDQDLEAEVERSGECVAGTRRYTVARVGATCSQPQNAEILRHDRHGLKCGSVEAAVSFRQQIQRDTRRLVYQTLIGREGQVVGGARSRELDQQ